MQPTARPNATPATPSSPALYTDHYELTMLTAALADGAGSRPCVFEVFARALPPGRRYGVVAGTGRLLDAIEHFRFDAAQLEFLVETGVIPDSTANWLADYRFAGDIDGYAEGELYFPGSPILTVSGTFAEAILLETLALSVLNHDSAIASAAARMVTAAGDRPLLEMGSRRTHEEAAVASARAAYVAGFAGTSNLAAGQRYGIPTMGTAAHAFTLLHDTERAAFASQLAALGPESTLLVDTFDITAGIEAAIAVAGQQLGAIRIDSGDLAVLAHQARAQLNALGATNTKIVLSGDLDEFALAALAAAPVDSYGVGTALVTGSGAPTAGMVYKLVSVQGRPVAKRSPHKMSRGGRKRATRQHRPTGTAVAEVITDQPELAGQLRDGEEALQVPLVRGGRRVAETSLATARTLLTRRLQQLPWEGLKLSPGEPAVPTMVTGADVVG